MGRRRSLALRLRVRGESLRQRQAKRHRGPRRQLRSPGIHSSATGGDWLARAVGLCGGTNRWTRQDSQTGEALSRSRTGIECQRGLLGNDDCRNPLDWSEPNPARFVSRLSLQLSLIDVLSGQSQCLVDEHHRTDDATVVRACVLAFLQTQSVAETSRRVDGFRSFDVSSAEPSNLEAAAAIAGNTVSLAMAGPDLNGRFDSRRCCCTGAARVGANKTDRDLRRDGDFSCVYSFTRGA